MILVVIFTVLILIFLAYSILPTIVMRTFSIGVTKQTESKGKVALTFDDGPDPKYTPQLLDLLKEHKVKATFFVVGSFAKEHPVLIQRMDREGHSIGIHHYKHLSNWKLIPGQTRNQCRMTAEVITKITGKKPKFYRPPWGHLNLFTYWSSMPFHIVMWSGIFGDWKAHLGVDKLVKRLKGSLTDGAILVLHDSDQTLGADIGAPQNTIAALKLFLPHATPKYEFVTIDEMLIE